MIPGLRGGGYKMNLEHLAMSEIIEMLKKMSGCRRQLEGAPTGHICNYLRTKNKRTIMNYRPLKKRRIHQFTMNINKIYKNK